MPRDFEKEGFRIRPLTKACDPSGSDRQKHL